MWGFQSLHQTIFFSVLNKSEIDWSGATGCLVMCAVHVRCIVLWQLYICGSRIAFPLKKYQGVKLPFIPSILHPGSAICCIQIEDFACTSVASPSWSSPLWNKLQRSWLSVGCKTRLPATQARLKATSGNIRTRRGPDINLARFCAVARRG